MKRFLALIGLAVSIPLLASAQSLTASYVQGPVSVQINGSWTSLNIGDTVASDAQIRLGDNAYAEISSGSVTIRLMKSGTYAMRDLFAQSQAVQSASLGGLLAKRLASLATPQQGANASTVGGVRGADVGAGAQTQWAGGGDPTTLIQQGLSKLQTGNYNEAYYNFSDAYDAASSDQAPAARFYMGYAAFLKGDIPTALKCLTTFTPSPTDSFYANQELTLAQAQIEVSSYQDALNVLSGYLKNGNPSGQNLQTAYLLQGVSYDALGNSAQAKSTLQKARDINPGSDVGQSAAKVLAGL